MKRHYILSGLLTALLFSFTSCDDFLTQEPKNAVTNLNYWKTEADVEAAVYGMHNGFRGTIGDITTIYRARGYPFDELGDWQKTSNNDFSEYAASSGLFSWESEYNTISKANLVLDNLYRTGLSKERYNNYRGQALCVRAYLYFRIIRDWGDAPLVKNSGDVTEKGRTPWRDIADFIIADLKEAATLLPPAGELKDASGAFIGSKQIPSRQTANAILTEVYGWVAGMNDEPALYTEGIKAADAVIGSGDYFLAASPEEVCEKVLLGNSPEGIFEIDYRNISPEDLKPSGSYVAGFCQKWPIDKLSTPSTYRSAWVNNTTVFSLYPDKNDLRREAYFYKLDSMATVPESITRGAAYIQKWRHTIVWTSGPFQGRLRYYEDNEIILRLATIYLYRAEYRARTGDTQGAISDLNVIRARAGAAPYSPQEGDLIDAILMERERELFLESDDRFYTAIRTGTYPQKLRGAFKTLTKEDIKRGGAYLPVSSEAAHYTTLIEQTDYWKTQFPF